MGNTQKFQIIDNDFKECYTTKIYTHGRILIQVITYEDKECLIPLMKEKWHENGCKKSKVIFPCKKNNFRGIIIKYYGTRSYSYIFEIDNDTKTK
jgi:hypothetical protein